MSRARDEESKRRGINGAASQYRKEAAKAGHQITHEQAVNRVRPAVLRGEKQNRG